MNLNETRFKLLRKTEVKNGFILYFEHAENSNIGFAHNVDRSMFDSVSVGSVWVMHLTLEEVSK